MEGSGALFEVIDWPPDFWALFSVAVVCTNEALLWNPEIRSYVVSRSPYPEPLRLPFVLRWDDVKNKFHSEWLLHKVLKTLNIKVTHIKYAK